MNISKFIYVGAIGLLALTSCDDDTDDAGNEINGTAF